MPGCRVLRALAQQTMRVPLPTNQAGPLTHGRSLLNQANSDETCLGRLRLAAHAVPTANNTGMNTPADGGSRFCGLYGSHEPFDAATLQRLYPTHAGYVEAVREMAGRNLADGYILPYAAEQTIREAEASKVGR
ncbi:MAG TPA: alpha/beta hydrolase domain-containing protein [Vicinamibacterales bacterium]|nr:alpha/beta hydrolase domain-containing protein [Vicinamibacterales bacterium]